MSLATHWYVEMEGVSRGPMSEDELADRVQRHELTAEALIWHPGLESWGSVQELRPHWLKPVVEAAEPLLLAGIAAKLALGKKKGGSAAPASLPGKPKAGLDHPASDAATKEPGGLLQRLFGFGKRKT